MNWTELKKRIYFEDGSLRDIYVFNTSIADWRKWVDVVNAKYAVEFYDAKTDLTKDKIDFKTIEECWSSKNREWISATVRLGPVSIKCHFFGESEIENDIDPREVKSIDDHNSLMNYLKDVSTSLDKDIFLTDENTKESIMISVKRSGEFILNSA